MTPGSDNDTADGFKRNMCNELIEESEVRKVQTEACAQRIYQETERKNARPLGIPSFRDKLCKRRLECFWKQSMNCYFMTEYMVCRPREVVIQLDQIKKTNFRSVKWFIEARHQGLR